MPRAAYCIAVPQETGVLQNCLEHIKHQVDFLPTPNFGEKNSTKQQKYSGS